MHRGEKWKRNDEHAMESPFNLLLSVFQLNTFVFGRWWPQLEPGCLSPEYPGANGNAGTKTLPKGCHK